MYRKLFARRVASLFRCTLNEHRVSDNNTRKTHTRVCRVRVMFTFWTARNKSSTNCVRRYCAEKWIII